MGRYRSVTSRTEEDFLVIQTGWLEIPRDRGGIEFIGKRKQVAGIEGFLDARGEAGADAVVAFVFHGHRRIAFGDARGLVGDGGVGFGRSVSGEGGDGGQQQGEAQSQRAEIGVHTSAS